MLPKNPDFPQMDPKNPDEKATGGLPAEPPFIKIEITPASETESEYDPDPELEDHSPPEAPVRRLDPANPDPHSAGKTHTNSPEVILGHSRSSCTGPRRGNRVLRAEFQSTKLRGEVYFSEYSKRQNLTF